MNINQKLKTTNNFREENEKMKNLTKNDYKNIESKVSGDLIFKDKKHVKNRYKIKSKGKDNLSKDDSKI